MLARPGRGAERPGSPGRSSSTGCGSAGLIRIADSLVECLGAGDCVPGVIRRATASRRRWCCASRSATRDRAAVERFTKEFAPLVTAGPPGMTGYTTGRPAVREVFAYWPALIAKTAVDPYVTVEIA